MQRIIENDGFDIDQHVPDHGDPGHKTTLLHLAVEWEQEAILEYLLSKGANPNSTCSKGMTPLHLSSSVRGVAATVRKLIEAGALIDEVWVKNNGVSLTPLQKFFASKVENVDAIEFLLALREDPLDVDEAGIVRDDHRTVFLRWQELNKRDDGEAKISAGGEHSGSGEASGESEVDAAEKTAREAARRKKKNKKQKARKKSA